MRRRQRDRHPDTRDGLALFTFASLGCALSNNLWLIVGLRCVQAAGGATLTPTSLGLILTTIPGERRQFSVLIWAITGSLGAAAGPALGGLLVALSWRWIFVINVPIGLLAMALTYRYVPNVRHNHEARIPDLLGGVLLIVAVGALALGLVQAPSWGWGSAQTITCFVIAIAGLVVFLFRSAHAAAPVVDLALFKDRIFARANAAMFFLSLAFGLQLLGLILWMQDGWGWSALQTGLAIAPGPVMVSVAGLGIRPRLSNIPEGVTAAVGVLLMGAGGALIGASIGAQADYAADVLPGWAIIGLGVGLALPNIIAGGAANLAPQQTSTGSAVIQMGRWIGTTIGVSLLVIVLGTSTGVGATVDSFSRAWYWACVPAILGAVMALGITQKADHAVPAPAPSGR